MEKISEPWHASPDLPLTQEQLLERETWMMENGNWREDHSVPSVGEHYRYMWKWDSLKAAVINARRDDPDRAKTEITTLERYRDPHTGFISNIIYATAPGKTWRDYPEAWYFNNNEVGSSYSQPPIGAWAAMETYRSFERQGRADEGLQFLAEVYGTAGNENYTGLQGEHAYFINHRQNSPDDPLTGIIHAHETGRDSDQANKPWLVTGKPKGAVSELLQLQKLSFDLSRLGRDSQGQRIDWIPEQVREKYWVNDVMFNAMHASNLRYLADIAGILSESTDDARQQEQYEHGIAYYQEVANKVEAEILGRMWNSEQGFFYNLDQDGNQIPVDSITGLFPLMLENITETQVDALLDKLESQQWFATPYPIPTHAVRSEFYDTDPAWFKRTFTPPWSGPVWIDANMIITEEGLARTAEAFMTDASYSPALAQRALEAAGVVAERTEDLLAMNPKSMECYSAESGKGIRVEHFMWSNLGLHFERSAAIRNKARELMVASSLQSANGHPVLSRSLQSEPA